VQPKGACCERTQRKKEERAIGEVDGEDRVMMITITGR
jgi:hypothetical protein